jgi:hypothetical protein
MTVTIQLFANADTGYVSKLNNNFANVKAAVEALQGNSAAALGTILSTGASFAALFGTAYTLIGSASCLCHGSGATLTVDAGYFWNPVTSTMANHSSSTLDFTGLAAATYYVTIDDTGAAARSAALDANTVYSVVWSGAAFGAITRVAPVFMFGAGDSAAVQVSTAMATSYDTVDARFEAIEVLVADLESGSELIADTDITLAANSDLRVATQKATKAYVDAIVTSGATDVMIFKGIIDASANPNYPAADAGHLYKISVAGKIGGGSGPNVEVGDTIYCISDFSSAANHATVGANWVIAQVNTDGAVIGPASATGDHFAQFDGGTGKLIKGGISFDTDGTMTANSNTRVPSQAAVRTYVAAAVAGAGSGTVTHTSGALTQYAVIIGNGADDAMALASLGTAGQVLTSNGAGAAPTWQAAGGGGGTSIAGTTGATGGDATATGGTSTTASQAGGGVIILGGTPGVNASGGVVSIQGGPGGTSAGNGGAVSLRGGTATVTGANGGAASLLGGTPGATATGGAANVTGANGGATSGAGGPVNITGGSSTSGAGGVVTITAGASSGGATKGGNAIIQGGGASIAGDGGDVEVKGGNGGAAAYGGSIKLNPGTGAGRGQVFANGAGAALATGATGGHFFIPTCAGIPTGTPGPTLAGNVPMIYDTTNNNLYIYNAGWKKTTVFA